jgi:hypothetical protein
MIHDLSRFPGSLTAPAKERSARFTSSKRFTWWGDFTPGIRRDNTAVKFPACALYVELPPLGRLRSSSRFPGTKLIAR